MRFISHFPWLPRTRIFSGRPRGEFDQAVIEQRLARFEAHCHAGAVDLGEDIAWEPEHQVRILRAVEPRAGLGPAHRIDEGLFGAIAAKLLAELAGIEAFARSACGLTASALA